MSNDRVKRALEKRALRVQRERQDHQLNGRVGETMEEQRAAFRVNFSVHGHRHIEPQLRHIEEKVKAGRSTSEWSDEVEESMREVDARVVWSTEEDQIELILDTAGSHANLVFRADPRSMAVEVFRGGALGPFRSETPHDRRTH